MIEISVPNDERIQEYREIRERDLVGRKGLFIAEGEVVLRVLVRSDLMETLSVLIAESRVTALQGELTLLPIGTPVYVASQAVMDSIVGFPIHRGILALGRRKEIPSAQQLLSTLPAGCVVLALHGISNHDNMGGIFRNAAAFGVNAVIADASSCDPLYRKAIRVSVGGVLRVPFARLREGEDLIDLLKQHDIEPLALSPSGTTNLHDLDGPPRAGIILGAEGPGLPSDMMKRCATVSIPIAKGFDSLNVATTSGIVLHHLSSRFLVR